MTCRDIAGEPFVLAFIRSGGKRRLQAQRHADLLATRGERVPEALLDGRQPVADGAFVHPESRAGRSGVPVAGRVGPQRLQEDLRALSLVEQRTELALEEVARRALVP